VSEGVAGFVEDVDVVDDVIVALDPVSELGAALDDDFGEQLGGGQRRRRVEGEVFEPWVLLAYGLLGQIEGV